MHSSSQRVHSRACAVTVVTIYFRCVQQTNHSAYVRNCHSRDITDETNTDTDGGPPYERYYLLLAHADKKNMSKTRQQQDFVRMKRGLMMRQGETARQLRTEP